MEDLKHFTHPHPLSLVYLNPDPKSENIEEEEEEKDGDEDDFYEEEKHGGQCNMCKEQIYSFHLCYYECKSCDYSLHKFCAELPKIQKNHPLHPGHNLTLSNRYQRAGKRSEFEWKCCICDHNCINIFSYYCNICNISIDIICATMSEQKLRHPSHPHQLERMFGRIISMCVACGEKQDGHFFHCTSCPRYWIHVECAMLPAKLIIQHRTNDTFTHSHPLTLAYSFSFSEKKARFYPKCRVCGRFFYEHLWIYKCDKCRYYVHVHCATSKGDAFMSILLPSSLGKTFKNYKDNEHPNLLHCPFSDEGDNLLKHLFFNQTDDIVKHDGEMLNHSSHQHPLNLFHTQTSQANKVVSLHDPMKKIQLLCDGCVKPITTVPFYKCSQSNQHCDFILHEWCAKLPPEVQDYAGHPNHKLVFLPKVPRKLLGVFFCPICELPSNGFAYGCMMCEYYVCINCAFIPEEITHEAHPGHLLSKTNPSDKLIDRYCRACFYSMDLMPGYHCPSCDIYIHSKCALLLPRVIRHKYDKHPLSLRYEPAENHISEYFCDICEDEFNPWEWFYHCTTCEQSMHAACVPLILQCEQATYSSRFIGIVFKFLNVKFGRTLEIKGHSHRLAAFVQGIERHGNCIACDEKLQYEMIFKCLECEFAFHYRCAYSYVDSEDEASDVSSWWVGS